MIRRGSIFAGAAYFAVVFAIGFVLGTVRVLALAPRLGELGAGLVELPVILTASWFVAAAVVRRFAVPATVPARALMGGTALILLLAAEAGLAVFLFGRTLAAHLGSYGELVPLMGLMGQIAFAAFPLMQIRRASNAKRP